MKHLYWKIVFLLSLIPGIGGLAAAYRALYLIAAIWQMENIHVFIAKPSTIIWIPREKIATWVSEEIKAMESEREMVPESIKKDAKILGKDPGRALDSSEGSQPLDSYWRFILDRRRTASTAWLIWAAIQFALGSMVLGIISLAVRC